MVHSLSEAVKLSSPAPTSLPEHAQPWETWMVLFGLPGAAVAAFATCVLAVLSASTDPMVAIAGIGGVLSVYLGAMGLLWVATANELR